MSRRLKQGAVVFVVFAAAQLVRPPGPRQMPVLADFAAIAAQYPVYMIEVPMNGRAGGEYDGRR
jgi:hypothetical protein